MYKASLKVSPLDARPELISYITGLKFLYVGDTEPQSKLTIGICHLWLWARFMATQIWAINFATNCELHQYSGDNNEPICCPKCSFTLPGVMLPSYDTIEAIETI